MEIKTVLLLLFMTLIQFGSQQNNDRDMLKEIEPFIGGVWKAENNKMFKSELRFKWSPGKRFVFTNLKFINYEEQQIGEREGVYVWNPQKEIIEFWDVDIKSGELNTGKIIIEDNELHFKEFVDGDLSNHFSSKFVIVAKNEMHLHWLQKPDGAKYDRPIVKYVR